MYIKTYNECHYCLEGIQHNKLCDCACPSCESFKRGIKQNIFNDILSKAIEKSDPNWFINFIIKGFRDGF